MLIQEALPPSGDVKRGITYTDFLKQWNEDKEAVGQEHDKEERPWLDNVIIRVNNKASRISDHCLDTMMDDPSLGHENFGEQKALSQRKMSNSAFPALTGEMPIQEDPLVEMSDEEGVDDV